MAQSVETPHYNLEGRGFDHCFFFETRTFYDNVENCGRAGNDNMAYARCMLDT